MVLVDNALYSSLVHYILTMASASTPRPTVHGCPYCTCTADLSAARGIRKTPRQKVDEILNLAERLFQWSLSDVVGALLSADAPVGSKSHSPTVRSRKIAEAVCKQDRVQGFLEVFLSKNESTVLETLAGRMRKEQSSLREQVPSLGQWTHDREPGEVLNIVQAIDTIQRLAPLMYGILRTLSTPRRATLNNPKQYPDHSTSIFFIIGILSNCAAEQSSNYLQKAMGHYFKSNIGRRRMINVLSRIGITESWQSITNSEAGMVQLARVSNIFGCS